MTFDFVLNNDTPLVFPDTIGLEDNIIYDSIGLKDNIIYDPETHRLYNRDLEDSENDYEYRWSRDKWTSDVDLSMRKVLDDNFVNIPGDVMTGGLQMGEDIFAEDPENPGSPLLFNVRRYNLEALPWMTYDTMTVYQSHTLRCNEYVLNNRVTVDKNAVVFNVKKPAYETKWYKLKLDPTFSDVDPYRPIAPTEADWTNNGVEIATGTNIVLSENLVEGNSWIRTIQTISETSDEVNPKPSSITSICDTPFITHQTTIPPTP